MRFPLALSLDSFYQVSSTLAVWRFSPFIGPQEKLLQPEFGLYPGGSPLWAKRNLLAPATRTRTPGSSSSLTRKLTMEGKLAIGAHAAVDRRSSDGKNIAAHMVAVADSGSRP